MYNIVIFDLDGTLLNTIEDLGNAVNHALDKHGFPMHEISEYDSMVGHGVRNLVINALPEQHKSNSELVDKVLAAFKSYYVSHIDVCTRPYNGIPELLAELNAKGVKMAVASNKFQSGVESLCKKFFPDIPFISLLGNQEGLPLKPDPEIVLSVLRKCDGAVNAVMVGDSATDINTAKNGGIDSVAVCWGFRPKESLEQSCPVHIAETVQDLCRILL